jgi:hypothetical protein
MTLKICHQCQKPKDLETGFSRDRSQKDGRQNRCKACNNEYRLAHKAQINRYKRSYNKRPAQRAYRQAYEETHPKRQRPVYLKNRAKRLAAMRAYYRKNKAAIAARQKAYNLKNKERLSRRRKARYRYRKLQRQLLLA